MALNTERRLVYADPFSRCAHAHAVLAAATSSRATAAELGQNPNMALAAKNMAGFVNSAGRSCGIFDGKVVDAD